MKLLLIVIAILMNVSCAAGAVSIIQDGRSNYSIVTPKKKTPALKYAANELQSFIYKMSGVRLPIVSENLAGDGRAFLLGPCRKVVKAGLIEQAAKLKEDGVLIKSIGSDIALIGQNDRGQIYSVYVMLEKYLGVRFLAWDCTVIPRNSTIDLPNFNYSYSPPFMYREVLGYDSFPKVIATRQRLNGPMTKCDASVGGKIDFYPYVHSFNKLIPPEEYYKDHPEYFGLQGGKRVSGPVHAQLCLTNPDVLRLCTEKVFQWIKEHPDVPIIDVSQNDGNGPCECENCMAIVNAEGSQHGPILRFVNAIADEVGKKYPEKWIETLAYAYAMTPPAITKPNKNVIIRLCHAGCYYHGFEQCGLGANLSMYLDQWSKLTKRVFVWHYATNFAHYLAPNPNLSGLAKDIIYYGTHGMNGLMIQCDYQGHGGELAEMKQYLSSQLMWDPSRKPVDILNEFCKGYYGSAANDVLEFVALMDRTAQDPNLHAFGAWDPQEKVSPDFLNASLAILEKARANANSSITRNHVEKLMLSFWYMQLVYTAKYGVSDKQALTIWQQARRVILKNKIDYIQEGDTKSPAWIANMDNRFRPLPKNTVFDLLQIDKATVNNCADWRNSGVTRNGRTLPTIYQHPKEGDADASYTINLPKAAKDKKLVMRFGTVVTNKSDDGVKFSVLVDGKELWNLTQMSYLAPAGSESKSAQSSIMPNQPIFKDTILDLTQYAGKTITLTLRVNPIGGIANDWANWIEPRILWE
jgi:hypothetical protein